MILEIVLLYLVVVAVMFYITVRTHSAMLMAGVGVFVAILGVLLVSGTAIDEREIGLTIEKISATQWDVNYSFESTTANNNELVNVIGQLFLYGCSVFFIAGFGMLALPYAEHRYREKRGE